MNKYIPELELIKRKKIEIALVLCDIEMKKLLEDNPWILDFLDAQLTEEQVDELDETQVIEGCELNFYAHDLTRVVKTALDAVDITGRDFAKIRVLRNDGLIPNEQSTHKIDKLEDRRIFVCCRSIKDINIDIIVDFSEVLSGYFKAIELRDIYLPAIIADILPGNNATDDIFTISEQHGRLPEVAKLLEVVQNNCEKVEYLPRNIKNLFLRDKDIRRQYIAILGGLPFDKKKQLISVYSADILQDIFAIERDLAVILQQNYASRQCASLSILKLRLAIIAKNNILIQKYTKSIKWDSVGKSEIKDIFFLENEVDDVRQLTILKEIPAQQVLKVGKLIQDATIGAVQKTYIARDILLLFGVLPEFYLLLYQPNIPEIFENIVLYSNKLKIVLDKMWHEEDYCWRVHDEVDILLRECLGDKIASHVKSVLLTVTIFELKNRKYKRDLDEDVTLADVATLFLSHKTFRPDLGIDTGLITRLNKILVELRVIVRNGDASSYENDAFAIPFIAHVLYHFKGAWKALKPLLLLFRAIPYQCVNLEQEVISQVQERSDKWLNIPWAITSIIARISNAERDANEVRLSWFKDMAERLKPVKGNKSQRRTYEEISPEFKDGFAPALKEPHPLWRLIYCESAGDLRVNPSNKGRFVFEKVKENDRDKEVRDAARKTSQRIAKIKNQVGEGSQKTALMNAWWWYRIGHILAAGGELDMTLAEKIRSKEVRRNYMDK